MFRNIKYTLLSMIIVLKHLFKRPVTLEYPEKKYPVNDIYSCNGCNGFDSI